MSGATASDVDLDPLTYAWTVDSASCSFDNASALNPNLTCSDNGSYTATLSVEDGVNPAVSSNATVTVDNISPTIVLSGVANVDEGSSYALTLGAVTDPGADTVTDYVVNWGDGNSDTYQSAGEVNHTYADGPNSQTISVDLVDEDDTHENAGSLALTVDNVAPTLGAITVDQLLIPVNTVINASADFSDPGTLDAHSAAWDWGDTSSSVGTVTQGAGSGSVSDSHGFGIPGVYLVTLTVTDNDGAPSNLSTSEYIVVYDPDAGFVTGSGQIFSPAGALVANPSATSKGKFGFSIKYKKDGSLKSETEFELKVGGESGEESRDGSKEGSREGSGDEFHFHSSSAQWLVISDAKAYFQGTGRVEGSSHQFGFRLTVIDDQAAGDNGVDMFRLRIWDMDDNYTIVYDNELGVPVFADPTTPLSRGKIKRLNVN